jgi:hypothetical protein
VCLAAGAHRTRQVRPLRLCWAILRGWMLPDPSTPCRSSSIVCAQHPLVATMEKNKTIGTLVFWGVQAYPSSSLVALFRAVDKGPQLFFWLLWHYMLGSCPPFPSEWIPASLGTPEELARVLHSPDSSLFTGTLSSSPGPAKGPVLCSAWEGGQFRGLDPLDQEVPQVLPFRICQPALLPLHPWSSAPKLSQSCVPLLVPAIRVQGGEVTPS